MEFFFKNMMYSNHCIQVIVSKKSVPNHSTNSQVKLSLCSKRVVVKEFGPEKLFNRPSNFFRPRNIYLFFYCINAYLFLSCIERLTIKLEVTKQKNLYFVNRKKKLKNRL